MPNVFSGSHDEPTSEEPCLRQRFFSLAKDGAQIFGKSPRTMRWWADTGRIRTVKIGRARYISASEIDRLLSGAYTGLEVDEATGPASNGTKIADQSHSADE